VLVLERKIVAWEEERGPDDLLFTGQEVGEAMNSQFFITKFVVQLHVENSCRGTILVKY